MKVDDFYLMFSSDCTAGSASQVLSRKEASETVTGRCWYRIRSGGEKYALLFSNLADGTFSDGKISRANDPGGEWDILSMRVGIALNPDIEPQKWITVSFDGDTVRHVMPSEVFCTDPFTLNARAGDVFCYEIKIRGSCYPYHEEIILPTNILINEQWIAGREFPVPVMLGCNRPVSFRIGFLGDSITQGIGTEIDSYKHYVSKIAEGLPANISIWNLGIGFARAMDAAACGAWIQRAVRCDTVNICLGVNDLARKRTSSEILHDLSKLVRYLKEAGCMAVLFTVPPFAQEGSDRKYWREINYEIRSGSVKQADAIFDIAKVLSMPVPEEYLPRYKPHPDAEGCAAVAKAYLESGITFV